MKQNKKLFNRIGAIALASTLLISGFPNIQLTQAATTFSMTNKITIGKGENFQLNVKGTSEKISFRSSNKKIVSVTKTGKIKGKKIGKATITAKANSKTKKCKVTVKAAPKKISFSQNKITLLPGATKKLAIRFSSGYSNQITYKSQNSAVASVSVNGYITAKSAGETTITAKTFNGKTAKINCIVADNSTSIPTNQTTATTVPTTAPAITNTPSQTTGTITNTPTASNTPVVEPTQEGNTEIPTITNSPIIETTDVPNTKQPIKPTYKPTTAPDNSPILTTEKPTTVPTSTPVTTATASAIVDVTQTPSAGPTETDTPTVTSSAIISKIEDGTIYIDRNRVKLQLTSCITYYKNSYTGTQYQITQEELLPGDTIEITSSGMISNTYPVSTLADCEQIVVTASSADDIVETEVSKLTSEQLISSKNATFIYTSNTKVYKNGQSITMEQVNEGDIVRVCAISPSDEIDKPACLEYSTGFINTLVVLGDSVNGLEREDAFFFYRGTTSPSLEMEVWFTDKGEFYISDDALLEIKNSDGTITYKSASDQHPPMTNLTIYYRTVHEMDGYYVTTSSEEENNDSFKVAVRICYEEEYEDPLSTIAPKKPVIYLYPEEKTDVTVDLDFDGELTYTYPYTEDGHWEVTADTDGTLTNKADGLEYSYLFWEGVTDSFTADFSKGFCVKGENTTKFLQNVLPKMGLTQKEYNEFIVYWAPLMQENEYNLISFQTKNYEQNAPLHINPAPDSMLRVYMAYKPLTSPVNIEPQTFEPFEREGFTVVEWGGCVVNN